MLIVSVVNIWQTVVIMLMYCKMYGVKMTYQLNAHMYLYIVTTSCQDGRFASLDLVVTPKAPPRKGDWPSPRTGFIYFPLVVQQLQASLPPKLKLS